MKKARSIIKYLSLSIIIILLLGIGYSYLFGDKIEDTIIGNINSKLNKEILTSEIEFSLLSNFPFASIKISDLLIHDSFNDDDTLVYAELATVKLNILDILSQKYTIRNLDFHKADLRIKYDTNGVSNFNILLEKSENNTAISLEKIVLTNCNIIYNNENKKNLIVCDVSSEFSYVENNLKKYISARGNFFVKNCVIEEDDYITNKNLSLNSNAVISKNNLKINASELKIENVNFVDLLFNSNQTYWNLESKLKGNIYDVIKNIPQRFQYLFDEHELTGEISASVQLKKENNFSNPSCSIDFELNDAAYKSKSYPFSLAEIYTTGNFSNGSNRNLSSSIIKFENFKSSKKNGKITGELTVSNFNNLWAEANLYSSWELNELNDFISDSPFKNLKGEIIGNTYYKGNVSFDDKMSKYFAQSIYSTDISLKNVYFNYNKSPLKFTSEDLDCKIENHNIYIKDKYVYINDTDLKFNGKIRDLFLYLLDQKKEIFIEGDIVTKNMNFDHVLSISELNDEDESEEFINVLPNWINSKINLSVESFFYDKFKAKNLTGKIDYSSKDLKLTCKDLKMKSLSGDIKGSCTIYENKLHDIVLKSNLNLNQIDISKGFESFNDFNQKYITSNNLKGIATSDMRVQAIWDKNYNFYNSSLNINSQLKIENGELIEFEPMYNLSDYVSIEELKNVKFATLENKIRIEDEKIIIPKMNINSSALSVRISGEHNFNNNMNFKVRLFLSELLGKKSKKRSKINDDDFIVDKTGKTTIQLIMKGSIDDPKISIDKVKIRKDVLNEILKESNQIKEIIEEKILNKTDTTDKKKKNESELKIEWDDENQ